ncbi:hypothetical protein BV898_00077 [Hypsibius exemplaris]|uniref:Uncharacterized protein n=1 Tax=Hypsibius exemplaris TaxID=2072580 RepID=A0A1W0XES5_HYPEX|nr:hypothetical protein BV898_00077 [Hypsibius exemplaris]
MLLCILSGVSSHVIIGQFLSSNIGGFYQHSRLLVGKKEKILKPRRGDHFISTNNSSPIYLHFLFHLFINQ